jgi:hypothetical protein
MDYSFEAYDVLQVKHKVATGPWSDFSTLRTEADAKQAVRLVDGKSWEGRPVEFQIVRGGQKVVVYSAPEN